MISQSAEYSLRAVVCLAAHRDQPLTIRQIAEATCAPAGYLAKMLSSLSRSGIITAQRGINGGYTLVKEPAEITLLDVVRVADASHRITTCPLGIPSHCNGGLCSLHRALDEATAAAERALATRTIADIVAGNSGAPSFCEDSVTDHAVTLSRRCHTCSK